MAYPDTELHADVVDPLYGGRPATEWGALAWQWVNNVLRVLAEGHLAYNRVPYRTVVAKVFSGALATGDVAVVDLGTAVANGEYVVRKVAAGDAASATVKVLGVCVASAGTGGRAVLAVAGVLPRTITGFASFAAAAPLAVNYTDGRLKVAVGGDVVVAFGDMQGNALLRLGG